ncbi:hypothetical protein D3C75_520780 [compost metagenome]
MRQMKLRSVVSKPYRVLTTDSKHNHPIAPNTLNQEFKVLKPNTVWVTDITYIPCREVACTWPASWIYARVKSSGGGCTTI